MEIIVILVGNQFVWIPCEIETEENKDDGKLKYDRYAFSKSGWTYAQTKLDEKDADGSYKIQRADKTYYYYHEGLPEQERISIEANGGFYIGRYEIGCDEERITHSEITQPGKVQKGLKVYNYITRDEAVTIAERMYEGKSKLCSSYAYDTTLKFIDGEKGIYALNSVGDNNGTTLNNITTIENTGYYGVKNIYDMGGNVRELTTEIHSYNTSPIVVRRMWSGK